MLTRAIILRQRSDLVYLGIENKAWKCSCYVSAWFHVTKWMRFWLSKVFSFSFHFFFFKVSELSIASVLCTLGMGGSLLSIMMDYGRQSSSIRAYLSFRPG